MNNELIKRILSSIILIPLVFFLIIEGSILFNIFLMICFFITYYEWYRMCKNNLLKVIGFYYLLFSFYTIYKLIYLNENNFYFLLIIIICIGTDIGGFSFGKILKGPKLTKISPNKTYAGMLGSFLLSIILSSLYLNNLTFFSLAASNIEPGIQIILMVLSISFVSQIGDIIISFFKRKSKIKNTGKIIPGHGGILDRIDGMIFAFPYVFILLKVI